MNKKSNLINKIISKTQLTLLLYFLPILVSAIIFVLKDWYIVELTISFLPYLIVAYALYWIFLFLIYLKNRKEVEFLLMLVLNFLLVIVFAIPIHNFYQPDAQLTEDNELSYNFLVVNVYYKNKKLDEMVDFFESVKMEQDVIALIEYTNEQFEQIDPILKEEFPFQLTNMDDLPTSFAGKTVYSKIPIRESDVETVDNSLGVMLPVVLEIPDQEKEVQLNIIHTTAPSSRDYFLSRNKQLDAISNLMENNSEPMILSGDLNTSPWSRFYLGFIESNQENYENISRNNYLSFSWSLRSFPILKSHIDHTFVSNEMNLESYEIEPFPGSDHKAQFYTLGFN